MFGFYMCERCAPAGGRRVGEQHASGGLDQFMDFGGRLAMDSQRRLVRDMSYAVRRGMLSVRNARCVCWNVGAHAYGHAQVTIVRWCGVYAPTYFISIASTNGVTLGNNRPAASHHIVLCVVSHGIRHHRWHQLHKWQLHRPVSWLWQWRNCV
jgi:hypothetical protein